MFRKSSIMVLLITLSARGEVAVHTEKASWQAVTPSFSTITFTELPANTWIIDQYSNLGIYFTDGSDLIYQNANIFADNFGLNGAFDDTTLDFTAPMTTIAMDFPGDVRMKLFYEGQLIYTSPLLGGGGIGNFAGLISTDPFDRVLLEDPLGGLVIDNLYFGPPIPAPGALTILGLAGLMWRQGRRRK